MTEPDFRIKPLRRDHAADVASLAAIYEGAIPVSERKPLAAMIASHACAIMAAHTGESLIGFAITFTGRGADLLEYLAVRGDQRGSGLGARLYAAARDAPKASERPLLIEVDSEREAAPDLGLRLRRKQFYRRLGARQLLGLDYILPLETGHTPPLIDLMIDRWAHDAASKAELSTWLGEVYAGAYGCAPDDPRIGAMLHTLPDPVAIA